MNSPLVSVIVPCYNHAQFVSKSIESVLFQTYKNIELIVIDDGSKDDSVKIINELRERYNFTFVVQENKGICRTLNRAIKEFSKGEYIALLASDDFWHADKIKAQIDLLARNPHSEFSYTQALEFCNDSIPSQGRVFPKRPKSGRILNTVFFRQHVPAGTMLFSRRLYDELGGFDESLKEEDWDFVIRAAAATEFTAVLRPLLHYRSHATNTMKTRSRVDIFHQKAKILSKNFKLVSPWIWYLSISIHFIYDIIVSPAIRRMK